MDYSPLSQSDHYHAFGNKAFVARMYVLQLKQFFMDHGHMMEMIFRRKKYKYI